MGYRYYIYEFDKSTVEDLQKCKTYDDYMKVAKKVCPEKIEVFGDEAYIAPYDLGKELYEFGKYYKNADKLYERGKDLFVSEELKDRFEDYGAIIIDKEAYKTCINWNKQKVLSIYENLSKEENINGVTQLDRLKEHVRDYLLWWEMGAGDENEKHDCIVASWLYEHVYFELIRILKTFDWENKVMVFMGW